MKFIIRIRNLIIKVYCTFTGVSDCWVRSSRRTRRQTGERWINWASTGYETNVASKVCDVVEKPLWTRRISKRQNGSRGWTIVWHYYENNNFQLITSSWMRYTRNTSNCSLLVPSPISSSYASKRCYALEYSCYSFVPPSRASPLFVQVSPRCIYKELLSRSSFHSSSHVQLEHRTQYYTVLAYATSSC